MEKLNKINMSNSNTFLLKHTIKTIEKKKCDEIDIPDNLSLCSDSSCESFDSWIDNEELLNKEIKRSRVNFKKLYLSKQY